MIGQLRTAFPEPHDSPGLLLWRVTNSWQRSMRAALEPYGVTHVQFVLLAVLTAQDREALTTQRDLAARASTDEMMTSQVLRALEEKGLVVRAPHPDDRRARVVRVTPAGVALVNHANAAVEAADAAYFAVLEAGQSAFTQQLRTLTQAHEKTDIVLQRGGDALTDQTE